MNLIDLGFTHYFSSNFKKLAVTNAYAGRVTRVEKDLYSLITEKGELKARISGKFRYDHSNMEDFPVVGDWVVFEIGHSDEFGIIHTVLNRKSLFSRKAVLGGGPQYKSGKIARQVLAANIDIVFIVTSLDHDFNLRRLERYLSIAYDSGARPIIILNKADLCEDTEKYTNNLEQVAFGIPFHIISAHENSQFDFFEKYVKKAATAIFIGSSGVGKSTIINRLLNKEQLKTSAVRESDSKGRHTTTWREMLILPGGGIVIDTPGMRELQAYEDKIGVGTTFADIEALAGECKFSDCSHTSEPGCAILSAIDSGDLAEKRFNGYIKLQREAAYMKRQTDRKARKIEQDKWKQITKRIRQIKKTNPKLKK